MDHQQLAAFAERFLGAWNSQDVERVLACYTADLTYRDPNTRGNVEGAEAFRRYLTKLFAGWRMRWSLREAWPLAGVEGAAVLWRATFRAATTEGSVEIDGMDLVLVHEGRIRCNDVYFDRTLLATLIGTR